jgi:RNA polymerase sigma factor (sigma-70 family)
MSFPATRLSVVERTRSDDEEIRRVAWATIIEAYWKPAYKYLRLKWSLDPDQAADLTQEFFTTTLEKELLERYDPSRARFRTYLRLCLDGFASNAKKAARRQKRGGEITLVPLDFQTAEGEMVRHEGSVNADVDELFYREWVRSLFERSVAELRAHAAASGRPITFDVFARYDLADEGEPRPTYAAIARDLGLTAATVTNHLAAMRRQFRQILLGRLRELTSSEEEFEAEAARLLGSRSFDRSTGSGSPRPRSRDDSAQDKQ